MADDRGVHARRAIGFGFPSRRRGLGDELLSVQVGEELAHRPLGDLLGRVAPINDGGIA